MNNALSEYLFYNFLYNREKISILDIFFIQTRDEWKTKFDKLYDKYSERKNQCKAIMEGFTKKNRYMDPEYEPQLKILLARKCTKATPNTNIKCSWTS